MLKRWFPVVAAVALLLTSAGAGRAQFAGIFGSGGAMSPWSGTGGWVYAPNGMGFNYYTPRMYGAGYGYPARSAWVCIRATACLPRSP